MKLDSKKALKIVAVILLVMLAFTIIQPVFAADINPTTIKGDADIKVDGIQTVGNKVATVIRNFAIVIGVIMLMVIGVKYMLGSAEEKADYKKSLMPLVIGIFIVMFAATIVSFVLSAISK